MTRQGANVTPGGGVPELDCTVMGAGRQHAAVSGEGDAGDPADEATECALVAAAGRVPELDRPVTAGRSQKLAVARESDGRDPRRMSDEGAQFPAARHVPELDGVVGVDAVAAVLAA